MALMCDLGFLRDCRANIPGRLCKGRAPCRRWRMLLSAETRRNSQSAPGRAISLMPQRPWHRHGEPGLSRGHPECEDTRRSSRGTSPDHPDHQTGNLPSSRIDTARPLDLISSHMGVDSDVKRPSRRHGTNDPTFESEKVNKKGAGSLTYCVLLYCDCLRGTPPFKKARLHSLIPLSQRS